ncbi:hypothetical protein NDU88_011542 [Pleurodeles waltl]|uniref:Uncharacterized protein n=1 Tax=Pleurodeles waltl TaxID=8319 RepID=A0AAV7S5S0_PLEWA|nr:hypothetical protein NDU88_011542 [Pleurodeles waltl]
MVESLLMNLPTPVLTVVAGYHTTGGLATECPEGTPERREHGSTYVNPDKKGSQAAHGEQSRKEDADKEETNAERRKTGEEGKEEREMDTERREMGEEGKEESETDGKKAKEEKTRGTQNRQPRPRRELANAGMCLIIESL